MGMPLDRFLDKAYAGLAAGEDHVLVEFIGFAKDFHGLVKTQGFVLEDLTNAFLGCTRYVVGPTEALNTS